jgi:zinc protease
MKRSSSIAIALAALSLASACTVRTGVRGTGQGGRGGGSADSDQRGDGGRVEPAGGNGGGGTAEPAGPQPSVLVPATDEPLIAFDVWFQVGSQDDPPGKEGLAWLTGQLLARGGTAAHSYDEILALLWPMATAYSANVDREMTTITGVVHRDNAIAFQQLLSDAYTTPAFAAADLERLRAEGIAYLEKGLRYAFDEELGKAALLDAVFAGTGYAHPPQGTVAGLKAITAADVQAFYRSHYTADRVVFGLAGGWVTEVQERLEASRAALPAKATAPRAPAPAPRPVTGRRLRLVDKPGADASISLGAPIDVGRDDADFYPLFLAVSWLGEHRAQTGQLFATIRGARGLNYGDYAYIEAYPDGGRRQTPPTNVGRRRQIFEVWVRTLPNASAHFALRAAIREVDKLIANGLTQEQFELRRHFLKKYILHYAETAAARLGYAIDDRFYGLDAPHLERFQKALDTMTLADVNGAIKRHLQTRNLTIAIATGDATGLRDAIAGEAPSKVAYASPKPPEILEEDRTIGSYPLGIAADRIEIVPVDEIFARGSRR